MRRSPKAVLLLPTGRTREVPLGEAARMLRNGEADLVGREPFRLRVVHTPVFAEEQRHLKGVRVFGAPRKKITGGWGNRPSVRTRIPRGVRILSEAERLCREARKEWLRRVGWEA